MRMIALPITLAALLAAGAAFAQGTGTTPQSGVQPQAQPQKATPEQRFLEMDTNKDGKVTKPEFMSAAEVHWTRMLERMDASKDGVVSKEEFLAPKPPRTGGQQPQR